MQITESMPQTLRAINTHLADRRARCLSHEITDVFLRVLFDDSGLYLEIRCELGGGEALLIHTREPRSVLAAIARQCAN